MVALRKQPRPHYHAPSAESDPVLGIGWREAAKQGITHYIRVSDYNELRPSNTRKPLPTSLNINRVDDGNPELKSDGRARRLGTYVGGLVFSPAFNAYIAAQVPHSIAETRLSCWRWFESEYVYAKVLQHFDDDWQAVQGIIANRRAKVSLQDVASDVGRGIGWLASLERKILRFVRDQYGMPGSIGPDVQEWQAPIEAGAMETGELAG